MRIWCGAVGGGRSFFRFWFVCFMVGKVGCVVFFSEE